MAYLNYENKRGSGRKLKVHFDLPEDDDYPNSIQRHSTSSIPSDSSADSDDTEEKKDNSTENFEPHYDGKVYESPVWSFQSGSVTQSPPVQLMSPSGYDPNRIPSSVFTRSASPIEWSAASNESLFSIHIGNASFTRDYSFALNKSGELPRISDLGSMPMTLPPVQEANHDKHIDMERQSVSSDSSEESTHLGVEDGHKIAETSAQVETTVLDKTPADHSKEASVPGEEAKSYASVSYRSVESDRSFHFPILTADGERSSSARRGRTSSSTVESEKQEKTENQQPEKPLPPPPPPEAKKAPKQGGRYWCFCFSCCH